MLINIEFNKEQILSLILQLPQQDRDELFSKLKEFEMLDDPLSGSDLKKLALEAPTWNDEDYDLYLEKRKEIQNSRLS